MSHTTPEQAAAWADRYAAGETYEQIALDVGLSTATVRRWAMRAGAVSRPAHGHATKNRVHAVDGIRGKPDHRPGPTPGRGLKRARARRARFTP